MAVVRRKRNERQMAEAIITGALKGINAWAMLVEQQAREFAPVDTSNLAGSIEADAPEMVGRMKFQNDVGTNVEYARAHELGSGIHALDPKYRGKILIEAGFWTGKSDKKALAFHWPGGPKDHPAYDPVSGKHIFRSVRHPGVPPANEGKGYLRYALQETKEDGKKVLLQALVAEMGKIGS